MSAKQEWHNCDHFLSLKKKTFLTATEANKEVTAEIQCEA